MTIVREQIDETGTLRLHTLEGAEIAWEFFQDDGVTADPTPPTTLRFTAETGFSKLLTVGASPHLFTLLITKAEQTALRAAATPVGQTKPRTIKWAVVDESGAAHQTIWEGLVEFEGW